jgi:hypothetical protein
VAEGAFIGSYVRPVVIILQKTVDNELFLGGGSEDEFLICFQPEGFINRSILPPGSRMYSSRKYNREVSSFSTTAERS